MYPYVKSLHSTPAPCTKHQCFHHAPRTNASMHPSCTTHQCLHASIKHHAPMPPCIHHAPRTNASMHPSCTTHQCLHASIMHTPLESSGYASPMPPCICNCVNMKSNKLALFIKQLCTASQAATSFKTRKTSLQSYIGRSRTAVLEVTERDSVMLWYCCA
jgi:hypothetical protein